MQQVIGDANDHARIVFGDDRVHRHLRIQDARPGMTGLGFVGFGFIEARVGVPQDAPARFVAGFDRSDACRGHGWAVSVARVRPARPF